MKRAGILVLSLFLPTVAMAQPCTTDARRVVNELYRHMLERQADAGSAHWVQQLESGRMTVRDVVRSVATSPEVHTAICVCGEWRDYPVRAFGSAVVQAHSRPAARLRGAARVRTNGRAERPGSRNRSDPRVQRGTTSSSVIGQCLGQVVSGIANRITSPATRRPARAKPAIRRGASETWIATLTV